MPTKPCIVCGTPTQSTRCATHRIPPTRTSTVQRAQAIGHPCWICGKPITPGTQSLDHYRQRRYGGTDHPTNLKPAHTTCNSSRG